MLHKTGAQAISNAFPINFKGRFFSSITSGVSACISGGILLGTIALFPSLTQAEEPVAIVDDIVGEVNELQVMDLLWEGQLLTLGSDVQVSIGYMNTCLFEKITGGQITIGVEKSTVVGGEIESEQLDCGQKIKGKSAGSKTVALTAVFRNSIKKLPKPDVTLYSLYPAVVVSAPEINTGEITGEIKDVGQLLVTRLNKKNAKPFELALENGRVDFYRHNRRLSLGGLYRISLGEKQTVIKISPRAKAENLALVQRLVKF